MMAESRVKTVDLVRIGFGQAVAVTPMQVLKGVSTVANGGYAVTPHFVSVARSDGKEIALTPAPSPTPLMTQKTADLVREMLSLVVSRGGGRNAAVEGYLVAGKTGTAQKYADGVIAQGKYVSSFVGFAPALDPKYAVMILVDEPQGWMYYGSQVAAPYASSLLKSIFDYEGIEPTEPVDEPQEYLTMPDLFGLTLIQAAGRLTAMGVTYEVCGEEGVVVDQVPAAGTKIVRNACAVVRLQEKQA